MNHIHKGITLFFVALLLTGAASCASAPDPSEAVRSVIQAQQAAWNRGDIPAFMDGYERAETTTFVSGDERMRGWQTVLDRYRKRYPTSEEMGMLTFSDLDIQPLGSTYMLADGRWKLNRAGDAPHGRFTLLFRQTGVGWRIVHDTTTVATP